MIAAYYCANCGETHSPGECPKAQLSPGCKSICHPDEGHAPDCLNRPPGVREYEELQRGSHPQTWHPQTGDLATGAQVEALRGEVAQLQRDAEYLRAHIEDQLKGMVEDRLAGLVQSVTAIGQRLTALEARWNRKGPPRDKPTPDQPEKRADLESGQGQNQTPGRRQR